MKHYRLRKQTSSAKQFLIPYEKELNEAQLKAVTSTRGPHLVVAGAGSGKTRTLMYRVAYLIERGVAPESILLLTFTKKAAEVMMRRSAELLDGRCKEIKGGTFHSFANSVLRRYATTLSYQSSFTIADRSDAEDIINLVRADLGYAKKDKRFPKKRTILNIISKSVNTAKSHVDIMEEEYPQFLAEQDAISDIAQAYHQYKFENSIMDYDDLLVNFRRLLDEHNEVRRKLSQENQYVMVDEFQDTNHLQADIAHLLASEHENLMVVGDDAQSIYSFRGANFRNIMDFPDRYKNCKKTTLEQNYRSSLPILEFCNGVMDVAAEGHQKRLFSNIFSPQKPVFLEATSFDEQAEFISQRILELREEDVPLDDIAVLFRSGWHSNELEIELNSCNIPFVKFGGLKFIEAGHIKDLVSFLRVVQNPQDAISWHRLLLLFEGIGTKTAQTLIEKIVRRPDCYNALRATELGKKKYTPQLEKLRRVLTEKNQADTPLQDIVRYITRFYKPLLKANYDDFKKRINDLDSFEHLAERYKSIATFVDDLSLNPLEFSQVGAEASSLDNEKLVLSTIHSAKGLEWHTVFVICLIDGFIPASQSLARPEDIEEERRLLYVACTRAKQNLYLICPQLRRSSGFTPVGAGGLTFSEPSRFLQEIDGFDELVEQWVLTEEEEEEED